MLAMASDIPAGFDGIPWTTDDEARLGRKVEHAHEGSRIVASRSPRRHSLTPHARESEPAQPSSGCSTFCTYQPATIVLSAGWGLWSDSTTIQPR